MVLWMMSMHSRISSSLIMRGGAKRMMSPWVGLASSPLSRRRKQTFQASQSRGDNRIREQCVIRQPRTGKRAEDWSSALVYFVHPTFCLLDDDGVEEAFPSDCCHNVSGQFSQLASQQLSHPLCVLRKPLLLQHLSHCNKTADRMSCQLLHRVGE